MMRRCLLALSWLLCAGVPAQQVSLVFAGDTTLDDDAGALIERGGDPLAAFAPLFAKADIRIANLECVVATTGEAGKKNYTFRAHPRVLPVLREALKLGVPLSEETPFHGASPYSISKIGTDYLGQFYGEAYGMRTFVTRMGTHSGPHRSDVFFESTVAKQIAMIEAGYQEPVIKVGNLSSTRTFQDARDAVRAYFLLLEASERGSVRCGEYFNIAGEEVFKLPEVIDLLVGMSTRKDITVATDTDRLRPIDADYQMFDNTKIRCAIDWKPEIPARQMFQDLLDHWRSEIAKGKIPLNR